MTPSPFFSILPVDLQILVLRDWFSAEQDSGRGLIRILSRLDMACCSSASQTAFRHLACTLPPFGEYFPAKSHWDELKAIGSVSSYMEWLQSRKVRLKALTLTGCIDDMPVSAALTLPSVEAIVWPRKRLSWLKADWLSSMIAVCPNVTCVLHPLLRIPEGTPVVNTPHLTRLGIGGTYPDSLQPFLAANPSLLELRVPVSPLTPETADLIIAYCPLLQILEVNYQYTAQETLLRVLEACQHVSDLSLYSDASLSDEEAYIMDMNTLAPIISVPQIKKFTVEVQPSVEYYEELFAGLLELRPDIEHLHLDRCKYSTAESSLELSCKDPEVMARILNVCAGTTVLKVLGYLEEDIGAVISAKLGGRLLSLNAMVAQTAPLEALLQSCIPYLRHLILYGDTITDGLLAAFKCPELETLALLCCKEVTDVGIAAVAANCPNISQLSLQGLKGFSPSTLQILLDSKLPLSRLQLRQHNFTNTLDALEFRQQVKEKQERFPVVKVTF